MSVRYSDHRVILAEFHKLGRELLLPVIVDPVKETEEYLREDELTYKIWMLLNEKDD